jgi:hypothetical protein
VPSPLGDLDAIDAAVQPGGQAGTRRSYGRRANGEACSAGVRASWRAMAQARR